MGSSRMNLVAKHVTFAGQISGVGFRFTVFRAALKRRLTGLVHKPCDGAVDVVIHGCPDDIDDCVREIQEAYKTAITETRIEEIQLNPQYEDFRITF